MQELQRAEQCKRWIECGRDPAHDRACGADQHEGDRAAVVAELPEEVETVDLADELVTRAKSTGATVSFIQNPTLLAEVDGVVVTCSLESGS